jgi:citrate synthase
MKPEDLISRALGVSRSAIDDSTSNRTLEQWDSLGHVTLVLELEASYGISLSTDETLMMKDVGTIKRVLRERGVQW